MKRRDAIKRAAAGLLGFLAAPFVAKAAEPSMLVSQPADTRTLADPTPDHIYGIKYWITNGEQPATNLSPAETDRLLRAIKRHRKELAQDFRDHVCPVWEEKLFGAKV